MPTAKGKSGPTSHRYRAASEYDDATLAQKREYWRNKKRQQRARGKPTLDSPGKKLLHPNSPAVVDSSLSFPLQSNNESHRIANVSPASQRGNTEGDSLVEAIGGQKERWLETIQLNKVSPQLPVSSCSMSAKAPGADEATCLTARGAASKAVTSPVPSRTQLNTSSSVPPVRVTRIANGSSAKTTPQPCVSMQGAPVPKMQHTTQIALHTKPKLLPTNVTTGMILVSSPCVPVCTKSEGKAENTTPQSGTKSALVTSQRGKGVSNPQPSLESEEERAAKRREHWRIKKREQRAKLAARIGKAKDRTQGREVTQRRQTAEKTVGGMSLQHLPPQAFLRGQKQCPPRVKSSFISARKENDKWQSGAVINLQSDQIKVKNPHGSRTQITSDVISVKKPEESQRRFPNYVHLSNVPRGIPRCKTPRQRLIVAQKNFMTQRSIRCKSPSLALLFGTRNLPKIDPNDTPEQIIAKRREYWRIKKRQQRAKMSMDVKIKLKEKDSLMRREKRYHTILEEMRRARALAQSGGSPFSHATETIGGFIKEDGTVTTNIPTDPNTTANKSEEELHGASNNTPISNPHGQPDTKQRGMVSNRLSQPLPRLCPAQVKVSHPLLGHSVNKPSRPLSIRPRTQLESTTAPNSLAIQTASQLTLTHPQNAVSGGSAAGSNLGGCVMKMAVSNSALSLDLELTEEEKMAKKREYWRIKKREQRAARAARLKHGVLQARASAALQRRKAQKHVDAIAAQERRLTYHTGDSQHLPNSLPITVHTSEIKQECESMPAVDLNSQPEQAICPDIKPPTSPSPPPAPQPEPDPALNADSQATTLLAVASMKKLLEESLSTVTECKSVQTDVKAELTEEAGEPEVMPNLTQLFFEEKDEVAPIAADLTLEIKSWQQDIDTMVPEGSTSPDLKDTPHIGDTPPPLSTSSEVVQHLTCEHSSQTPSKFIVDPMELSDGPSPRRTQRLCTKKASHQIYCAPEPPKLHHLPVDTVHCEQQWQVQEELQNSHSPSAQRTCSVARKHSGLTSLQRKREYWKMMKRQQRARSKARQTDGRGECSSRLSQKSTQGPDLIINTAKGVNPPARPALLPKPPTAAPAAISIPTILVVSPTTCNAHQSPDKLQVKLPVTSVSCSSRREQNKTVIGPSQMESDYAGAPETHAMSGPQMWMSRSTDVDSATCLPTLTPPDNPLSCINLQPIESPVQSPNSTLSPIKIPSVQHQSPTPMTPLSSMVPPKPIPGESEEDFLRRKREYWRIKKKEQRARKAIREKGGTPRRASTNWTAILPAQDVQTQDSAEWVSSSEESEHKVSTSLDTDLGSFPYSNYATPVEDESDFAFADYENDNGEEGPVSDTVWRNRYLMDYDPLNQLLVCMVCGELQYSHSLEGVRAHIDEAHPDTLSMDPPEKQRILEAWDEQVSQRERFFTSQLQQHSGALTEAHD